MHSGHLDCDHADPGEGLKTASGNPVNTDLECVRRIFQHLLNEERCHEVIQVMKTLEW